MILPEVSYLTKFPSYHSIMQGGHPFDSPNNCNRTSVMPVTTYVTVMLSRKSRRKYFIKVPFLSLSSVSIATAILQQWYFHLSPYYCDRILTYTCPNLSGEVNSSEFHRWTKATLHLNSCICTYYNKTQHTDNTVPRQLTNSLLDKTCT